MFTGLSYEMPFPADLWLSVSESSVGRIGEHVASRKAKSGPESPFQLFISMWVVVYSPNTVDFRVGSQSFHMPRYVNGAIPVIRFASSR